MCRDARCFYIPFSKFFILWRQSPLRGRKRRRDADKKANFPSVVPDQMSKYIWEVIYVVNYAVYSILSQFVKSMSWQVKEHGWIGLSQGSGQIAGQLRVILQTSVRDRQKTGWTPLWGWCGWGILFVLQQHVHRSYTIYNLGLGQVCGMWTGPFASG